MSLWYESLGMGLYDCADNMEQRAICILSHLSMPVPRGWWEHALESGKVNSTHACLLRELQAELIHAADHGETISSGLLVALAYADEPEESDSCSRKNNLTIQDCMVKAKKVLEKRPDLVQLGRWIDGKTE